MTNYDAIIEHLPKEGLLAKVIQISDISEICPRFRLFSFLGALGAVINRKIFIQRGSAKTFPILYPNPWVFLIAPQGKGKKSSALRIGSQILKALPDDMKPRMLSAKLTPEVLLKTLSTEITPEKGIPEHILKMTRKKATGVIISSELGTLLGKEKYLQGMAMLLTELYDCHDEWQSETIMRGTEKLYEVCLSIIAATTPDWMQTLLPKDAFEIGFMSRLVLIPLPRSWRPRVVPPDDKTIIAGIDKTFTEIVEEVIEIAHIKGEMVLHPETWEAYKKWYLNLVELPPGPQSEYLERKQDHAIRIAALLQLAQTQSLILEPNYYKLALDIMSAIEPEVMELINYISMEPRMRVVKKILAIIEFEKEVLESELMKEVWTMLSYPKEFDTVMELLVKSDQVRFNFDDGIPKYFYVSKKERK